MTLVKKQELKQSATFSADELKLLFSSSVPSAGFTFSISTDSRSITNKQIFLPLKGERFDGHKFIDGVLGSGIQYSFCEKLKQVEIKEEYKGRLIIVESTLDAYHKLAKYHRERINPKVIAVVGSSGKTTVKDLLAFVLNTTFKTHKTEANFNNEIGVPRTILEMPKGTEILILELAMRARGEIRYLAEMAKPDILVVTSIGRAHIGRLGSIEEIVKAKAEAFEFLNKSELAVVCNDKILLNYLKGIWRGRIEVFDISDVKNIILEKSQSTFTLEKEGLPETYAIGVPGRVHVLNSLIAITVAKYLGLTFHEIQKKLLTFNLPEGRGNIVELMNNAYLIDETYNANPDSVKVAVNALIDSWGSEYKKVLVLGELAELGKYEKKLLRDLGSWLAQKPLSNVVTVGNKLKQVNKVLKKEIVRNVEGVKECCAILKEVFCSKTVVLIKGSHVAGLDKVVRYLKGVYGKAENKN